MSSVRKKKRKKRKRRNPIIMTTMELDPSRYRTRVVKVKRKDLVSVEKTLREY